MRSPRCVGHGAGDDSEQHFLPFYAAYSPDAGQRAVRLFHDAAGAAPDLVAQKRARARDRATSAREVFLSLVDPTQAPFAGDLRQLSVQALCTNRDLVLQMPVGVGADRFLARHRGAGHERARRSAARAAATRRWPTARWPGARSATCR